MDPRAGVNLVDQGWSGSGPPPVSRGYVITSGAVSALAYRNDAPIPTETQPRLPFGLRAAVVEVVGGALERAQTSFFSYTLLGQEGQTLEPFPGSFHAEFDSVATRFWQLPRHPPAGVCSLSSSRPRLRAKWGNVALETAGRRGVLGEGFLSCIETDFFLDHSHLEATLLLNGETPGAPPAALPNARPLSGQTGIMVEAGRVDRRVGNAWLQVEGGRDQAQRVEALRAIHPAVRLRRPASSRTG